VPTPGPPSSDCLIGKPHAPVPPLSRSPIPRSPIPHPPSPIPHPPSPFLPAADKGVTFYIVRCALCLVGLTGDPIPAERAYQLGFVNQLVEPGQSLDAALQLAARVRPNVRPLSTRSTSTLPQQSPDRPSRRSPARRGMILGRWGILARHWQARCVIERLPSCRLLSMLR
jgi:hypothetical protein